MTGHLVPQAVDPPDLIGIVVVLGRACWAAAPTTAKQARTAYWA